MRVRKLEFPATKNSTAVITVHSRNGPLGPSTGTALPVLMMAGQKGKQNEKTHFQNLIQRESHLLHFMDDSNRKNKGSFQRRKQNSHTVIKFNVGGVRMNYGKYLGQIEKAHTKRKLVKLLELIGNDFSGISSRQYEELKFLILYKMSA